MSDKRRAETTWKIHRIHWEKNRFIYDLMYKRKVMSKELVSRTILPFPSNSLNIPCSPSKKKTMTNNNLYIHATLQLFCISFAVRLAVSRESGGRPSHLQVEETGL